MEESHTQLTQCSARDRWSVWPSGREDSFLLGKSVKSSITLEHVYTYILFARMVWCIALLCHLNCK